MRKILTIALREYRAMIVSKAFLISIAMMPLLIFGGMLAAVFLQDSVNTQPKRVAIHDPDGQIFPALKLLLESSQRQERARGPSSWAEQELTGIYEVSRLDAELVDDRLRLEMSDSIRRGELYAFVEIPPNLSSMASDSMPKFYSEDASISTCRRLMEAIIAESVRQARFSSLGLNAEDIQRASRRIELVPSGLMTESQEGEIQQGETRDVVTTLMLPMGIMLLMFMVIFLSAQPTLESVLEEKSQRIAEVLLGSANAFQLMTGKLLGTVSGSFTVFLIYSLGSFLFSATQGWDRLVPYEILPWFVVFQTLAVIFYASIFMAIGAAVSQLKEAQSLLLPVWLMMTSPMFCWVFAVREPNGQLATLFSFFPPATPTMMMLRLATGASIPWYQPLLGAILLLVCTVGILFVAARIFRIGLLWQGSTPNMRQLLKWGLFQ